MSKKIENKDLVQGNPFQPTQDQAVDFKKAIDNLNTSLNQTSDEFKEMLRQGQKLSSSRPLSGYDNIKQVEQGIRTVERANEGLISTNADLLQVQKDMQKQLEALQKENNELAKSIRNNTVANERYSRSVANSTKSLEELQISLDVARKELIKLNKEEKAGNITSEEASKQRIRLKLEIRGLNKEIREQTKALERQGNKYRELEQEVKQAQQEFKRLAAEYGVNSEQAKGAREEFEKLADKLEEIDKAARDGRKQIGQYERQLSKVKDTLKTIQTTLIVGLFLKLGEVFASTSTGADTLEKSIGRITITLREFTLALINSFKNIKTQGLSAFSNAFDGINKRIELAIKSLDTAVDATRAFRNAAALAADSIATLNKQQELLEGVSNDTTISLSEQKEALINLENATRQLFSIEVKLARQQVLIAKARSDANKDSIEATEALAQATSNLINIEFDQLIAEQEIFKRRREIISEQSELNLDILIDAADNQKTVNERIINDERVSLNQRRKLLKQTEEFLKQSFDAQINEVLKAQVFIRGERFKQLREEVEILKLRKEALEESGQDITTIQEEINSKIKKGLELRSMFTIDVNELMRQSDFKLLSDQIKNLGLSKDLQTRLLEIIKERKTAIQDLTETNKDLSESERESLEVQSDITLQAEALQKLVEKRVRFQKTLEELEEARRKQEIENITKRLETVEEGSEEELKLRQELLDKLIDQEAEAGRKIVEQRVKIQRAASQVLTGFSEKFFEGQINRLDEQLEAVRRRSDEIRELSQRNVQSAGDALAFQQRREAELERERERERKRQQKSKLLFAILDTVSAKAAAGDDQPLRNAIFEGALLSAFVEAFPSFDAGVDVTGKGNVDGKGGFFSVLHPNETVLSAKDRAAMGNPLSRKDIIANYNLGKSVINQTVQADHSYSAEIISGLQDVKQAIKAKPALTEFKVDELAGMVTTIIEQQGNKQRFMQKYTRKH